MDKMLKGKRVAILVTDGFEQAELLEPRRALQEAGAKVDVVSPKKDFVQGFQHDERGERVAVDVPLERARPADYDALLLPGGVRNPDTLRMDPQAVGLVRYFFDSGKAVAAICHGPWMLAEAEVLNGRTLTSWPSIKADLIHAGAYWVDEAVVVNGNLVTSRKPADIPAFIQKLLEVFAQVRVGPRQAA